MFDVANELRAWSVNVSRKIATPRLVETARSRGFHTLVYTVNDPGEALELERCGAKGVFTDYPDRIRASAAQSSPSSANWRRTS
jgi:glycerophosphoryl diester phosphodiesterase